MENTGCPRTGPRFESWPTTASFVICHYACIFSFVNCGTMTVLISWNLGVNVSTQNKCMVSVPYILGLFSIIAIIINTSERTIQQDQRKRPITHLKVLVCKQRLSNLKPKHIEETALLMAIFFLFNNNMKNLFFFRC